ncbi:hypothetical protein WJX84_000804 [Apatococcus fuscideae]|uniref:Zeta-carotene desaturase n=1 Tax=Apatococcus fuscideae TaxID=2026836 RepID=A0AAW1TBJ2_9CHLO
MNCLPSPQLQHTSDCKLCGLVSTDRQPSRRARRQAQRRGAAGRVVQAVAAPPAPAPRNLVSNVSEVGIRDAPLKPLFPDEPPPPKEGAPKLKVAIIGCGLAGLSTAVELVDQGHEVEIFEARPFIGGKVGSYVDRSGNHIELGLHVFFGCYHNLFRLMAKVDALENLLAKEHAHTFVNSGGDVRLLDFRFKVGGQNIGAPFHGLKAFFTTDQLSTLDKAQNSLALGTSPVVRALVDPEGGMRSVRNLDNKSFSEWFKGHGGSQGSIDRMWNPVAYALGFLDCNNISARCMLSIFQFFATKTDASRLRMLNGSPADRLLRPITDYLEARGVKIHTRTGAREVMWEENEDGRPVVSGVRLTTAGRERIAKADAYVAALDVPGAKRLIPEAWCERFDVFGKMHRLSGVPVITVQLRYPGWVTELGPNPAAHGKHGSNPDVPQRLSSDPADPNSAGRGLDNLLYSADADFSCFADLAITSPVDYYREGEGSLLQCVLTPADPYMPLSNEEIAAKVHSQVINLFPSAKGMEPNWHSIVKIGQSLYREAPGMEPFRPPQKTPIDNFFLAGSYTQQDYIDSMEGATLSGRLCAGKIMEAVPQLASSS